MCVYICIYIYIYIYIYAEEAEVPEVTSSASPAREVDCRREDKDTLFILAILYPPLK